MANKILLIGLGGLGSVLLERLALEPAVDKIVVGSRDPGRGQSHCNLVRTGSAALGRFPSIEFKPLDLDDEAATAELVERTSPDLVVNTASRQTWWLTDLLPPPQAARLRQAGFGVWLPFHLTLTIKLMRALRLAQYANLTITAPFPDVVNPILAAMDLAPTCGIGNLAEIVPKVKILTAERLGARPGNVHVTLVAHHALEAFVFRAEGDPKSRKAAPPFILRVYYEGVDVTETVKAHELLFSGCPLPPGPATHYLTGAATISLVRALFLRSGARVHVPGPNGLPGGYPVIASRSGVRLALPPGVSREEAIAVNRASHLHDGIQQIERDGAVLFKPGSAAIMRDTLGYDCERLSPAEAESRAEELLGRFRAYAARFGVQV